tara:strand:+ start:176 stop:352 length:177 start_codon:yes stop_codon:yes gene_type:complete
MERQFHKTEHKNDDFTVSNRLSNIRNFSQGDNLWRNLKDQARHSFLYLNDSNGREKEN